MKALIGYMLGWDLGVIILTGCAIGYGAYWYFKDI